MFSSEQANSPGLHQNNTDMYHTCRTNNPQHLSVCLHDSKEKESGNRPNKLDNQHRSGEQPAAEQSQPDLTHDELELLTS